ncbi:hypothetical protein PR048_028390 [Dryococelus australis]|uniref:Uncharacterized protein n=1 Tax=Dryococelus australis TaxID=614101 RepID=A0ABQ9GAF4_9NEOP|nr:hypothetical protein PR048_028390 [Dryococelus australis]
MHHNVAKLAYQVKFADKNMSNTDNSMTVPALDLQQWLPTPSLQTREKKIDMLDHKFMIPGHSRVECDSYHAVIEKAKQKYSRQISHLHDWAQLIRMAGKMCLNSHRKTSVIMHHFSELIYR